MVRPLNCIVAVSQNMGIGKNGNLPWPPLRNEFQYFQSMTTGSSVEGKQNLVIMGRKTWFSIPEKNRPLKDRINIVLSRELKEPPKGAHFLAKSLDDALELIEDPELTNKVDVVWIVGGSSVYKGPKVKNRIIIAYFGDIQVFLWMSRRKKALSTNLKYMKRTINVKMFSHLFYNVVLVSAVEQSE
ncbi:dihydrofolate reductase isoform X3 [Bubalus kerabau]|uniref:dihydrofolate reductase isoform X3 n=1 Tax=Bubalus carabanensis TaxID=3119969 RepID=UPI00244EF004|nr:dihydrofolate reductase isoform X3 [Bubalus carabanensis]